ncbi:hypothetical protein E3P81_01845 [Wallemia ichthyophaga]|nr:hypothetical protein E3P97_01844 [Wallemia ichthyophaga]TIB30585.1 hypothetical protein E3P85_02636 [Wallemia ichthyophaga]TIB47089.1 hypothetical protein E3P82_01905 [Wallemia ichthyophaga]TIB51358.1 hypothetical protein E3P81_01845 [Wallemia ichthyophaga]TIB54091.1 hypothetical protein E3P80_01906 [Wallemia ichthyophaga]
MSSSKTFDLSRFAYSKGNSSDYTSKNTPLRRSSTTPSTSTTPQLSRSNTDTDTGIDTPNKSKKRKYTYEPPESFAQLTGVPDYMTEGCDLMLVGINPGRTSATLGHHFAHPSNSFYSCLYESGLTPTKLRPQQDYTLPVLNYSITNLNHRPTVTQSQLSKAESRAMVPELCWKVHKYKPKLVALVGKSIWDDVHFVFKSNSFNYDYRLDKKDKKVNIVEKSGDCDHTAGFLLQNFKIVHDDNNESLFFTLPSTSGLVAAYQKEAKVRAFKRCKQTLDRIKESSLDTSTMHIVDSVTLAQTFAHLDQR